MGKNRLAPHTAAVLAMVFFAFLAIGSTASTPAKNSAVPGITTEETVASSQTTSKGNVNNIVPSPAERLYDTLGLVFATTVKKFNEDGLEVSGQASIVTLLLREAQKLGGNDIVNLRVDENVVFTQITSNDASSSPSSSSSSPSSSSSSSSTKKKIVTTKTVTYTGSALAIKYKN
jgi:hypothetical protein